MLISICQMLNMWTFLFRAKLSRCDIDDCGAGVGRSLQHARARTHAPDPYTWLPVTPTRPCYDNHAYWAQSCLFDVEFLIAEMGQDPELKICFAVLLISILSQCAFGEWLAFNNTRPYPAPPLNSNAELNRGVACRNDLIEDNLRLLGIEGPASFQ